MDFIACRFTLPCEVSIIEDLGFLIKWMLQTLNFCIMAGLSLLKVGGRMVYSTCSMNPVENEAVVAEVMYTTSEKNVLNQNNKNLSY